MPTSNLTRNECLGVATPEVIRLMTWIDTHDRPALTTFDADTGTLTVTSIEIRDGVACEVQDTIPATLSAARDLLGY